MGRKTALIYIIATAFMVAGFQNCSQFASKPADQGLPPVTSPDDPGGGSAGDDSLLTVSSSAEFLYFNETAQISVSGGTAPYKYAITSGNGTISETSGLYTAPSSATLVTITVTDNGGRTGIVTLSVIQNTGGSVGSCDTIPVSTSLGCAGGRDSSCTVNVTFSSKVTTGCKVKAIRLSARHFSGSGTCSLEAPLYFEATGTQSSGSSNLGYKGNKVALLKVEADFETKKMKLTSTAANWGECGGSPCNSCVSDISYELIQEPN